MKLKWLPIESAPKDGTWIIVNDGNNENISKLAAFHNEENIWSDTVGAFFNPTHWLPIPEFEEENEFCEWTNKNDKNYKTSCNSFFEFLTKHYKYCPECGKEIKRTEE